MSTVLLHLQFIFQIPVWGGYSGIVLEELTAQSKSFPIEIFREGYNLKVARIFILLIAYNNIILLSGSYPQVGLLP